MWSHYYTLYALKTVTDLFWGLTFVGALSSRTDLHDINLT